MFSVKFVNSEKRNHNLNSTIDTVMKYISQKLNLNNSKMISDKKTVEIISGKELNQKQNDVVIELIIKQHIVISNEDFEDREKLDEHISRIKHFCDQAKSIEDLKYLPIHMR